MGPVIKALAQPSKEHLLFYAGVSGHKESGTTAVSIDAINTGSELNGLSTSQKRVKDTLVGLEGRQGRLRGLANKAWLSRGCKCPGNVLVDKGEWKGVFRKEGAAYTALGKGEYAKLLK